MGSAAALVPYDRLAGTRPKMMSGLSVVGLACILVSVFGFDSATPFPGISALLPAVGTFLIILFTTPGGFVYRLLCHRILVGIGLTSYSAYLLHQPIFVFARYATNHQTSALLMGLLSLVSIAAAYLLWRFWEQPFRLQSKVNTWRLITVFAVFIVSLTAFSVGALATRGYGARLGFPPNVQWTSLGERLNAEGDVCDQVNMPGYAGVNGCEFGDLTAPHTIVLYGDSHAQAISRQLERYARSNHLRIVKVTIQGCGVIFDITASQAARQNPSEHFQRCNAGFESLLRLIEDFDAVTLIVSRWTFQFYPMEGYVDALSFDNGLGGNVETSFRQNFAITAESTVSFDEPAKRVATLKLLNGIAGASRYVIISTPIPETGWDIWQKNRAYFAKTNRELVELKFPSQRYLDRNGYIMKLINAAASRLSNARVLNAGSALCDEIEPGYCFAQFDAVPLYYDGDHLSDEGAQLVIGKLDGILAALDW